MQANNFDHEKTKPCVESYTAWRKEYLPVQSSESIIETLKAGLIYYVGRDHRFRPILVLRANMLNQLNLTSDQIKQTFTYFIEHILENAILPGQVENWIIITDLDGIGLTNVPYTVNSHSYRLILRSSRRYLGSSRTTTDRGC